MRYKIEGIGSSADKDKCKHYWLIESPKGPISKGVCKFCGAEREFYNSWRQVVDSGQSKKSGVGG